MNRETDELERLHVRLYTSNLNLLRASTPKGKLNDTIRDIINEHCELNRAALMARASGTPRRVA